MSLDYDVRKIPKEVHTIEIDGKSFINPVTEAIIFTTMTVDMGEITEENWQEFFIRCHIWDLAYNASYKPMEMTEIKPEDIKAHIGLKCNVITKSRTAWKKRVLECLEGAAQKKLREME